MLVIHGETKCFSSTNETKRATPQDMDILPRFFFFSGSLLEPGSHYAVQAALELCIAQAGLKLVVIHLPQPPEY